MEKGAEPMRQSVRELVSIVARHVNTEGPVYELGSYQVQPASISNMRPFFPGLEYIGCDARPGPGVDRVLDMHALSIEDEAARLVLCLDTLEHVERPWEAVREMHRILRPAGVLLLVTVMNFPIHEHPYDFWRFTPQGLLSLCGPLLAAAVPIVAGPADHPFTVGVLGCKGGEAVPPHLRSLLAGWSARWNSSDG